MGLRASADCAAALPLGPGKVLPGILFSELDSADTADSSAARVGNSGNAREIVTAPQEERNSKGARSRRFIVGIAIVLTPLITAIIVPSSYAKAIGGAIFFMFFGAHLLLEHEAWEPVFRFGRSDRGLFGMPRASSNIIIGGVFCLVVGITGLVSTLAS
jgi:hypothetical protein